MSVACQLAFQCEGEAERLFARRSASARNVRMIQAYAFILEGALETSGCGRANGALVADLLQPPGDARAGYGLLVLVGNTFGLLAPIVTGYVVTATGSFNTAFAVAGALALVGAVAALALVRGTLGEHARHRRLWNPDLAS